MEKGLLCRYKGAFARGVGQHPEANEIPNKSKIFRPMDSREVHKRIKEFDIMREKTGQNKVSLLEVALFVEDVFGLFLSDAEICEENLGTNEDTEAFVLKKLAI